MNEHASLETLTDAIEAVSTRYAERFGIRRDLDEHQGQAECARVDRAGGDALQVPQGTGDDPLRRLRMKLVQIG